MQSFFTTLPQTDEKIRFEINELGKIGLTNDEISKELNINKAYVDQIRPKIYTHKLYDDPPSYKVKAISEDNAAKMGKTDQIRAKYLNALVLNNRLTLGGRRTNKNKKKHQKLSRQRRTYSKKNRKSMKRK